MEGEPGSRKKERPTFVEQRRKPSPINSEGYWIAARRHPDKGYVEAWQWVRSGEPPIPEDFLLLPKTPKVEANRETINKQREIVEKLGQQTGSYTAGAVEEYQRLKEEVKDETRGNK
jgi:hypothetical protein